MEWSLYLLKFFFFLDGPRINLSLAKSYMAPCVTDQRKHSSTPAWKIPWTEEPGGLQSMGSLESDTTERLHFHFSLSCIGEGNGNSLQSSCLENPRDGEAWWAAVYGVAQSRTRLKRLSSSSSSVTDKDGGSDEEGVTKESIFSLPPFLYRPSPVAWQ